MSQNKRYMTWVLKCSKYCNLRCTYCYEFGDLGNKASIPLELYPTIFSKIRTISESFDLDPHICWHGGEPLMLPKGYLSNALAVARTELKNGRQKHVLQTNLTTSIEPHVDLLRSLDNVSISIDLFGTTRVTKSGTDAQEKILDGMFTLSRHGIRFGAIVVLNRFNISYPNEIFQFFSASKIPYRILPFYRSHNQEQVDKHAIEDTEIVDFMATTMDLWLSHGRPMPIYPIYDYFISALNHLNPSRSSFVYNKFEKEFVLIVDTDGQIYSVADTYNREMSYGNIFHDSSEAILSSLGRERSCESAAERVMQFCRDCSFFGSCSTFPVAEATDIERQSLAHSGTCSVVRPLISHMVQRIGARKVALRKEAV